MKLSTSASGNGQRAASSRHELSFGRTMRTPTLEPSLVGLTTNGAGSGSATPRLSRLTTIPSASGRPARAKTAFAIGLFLGTPQAGTPPMGLGDATETPLAPTLT